MEDILSLAKERLSVEPTHELLSSPFFETYAKAVLLDDVVRQYSSREVEIPEEILAKSRQEQESRNRRRRMAYPSDLKNVNRARNKYRFAKYLEAFPQEEKSLHKAMVRAIQNDRERWLGEVSEANRLKNNISFILLRLAKLRDLAEDKMNSPSLFHSYNKKHGLMNTLEHRLENSVLSRLFE
mmetsp:Transcript_8537/g.13180  ORF Transcript_8537/g.13180 Transcript_8537/m.13180 type:complete len:183 (-) Transcript_8537:1433-1981(-)